MGLFQLLGSHYHLQNGIQLSASRKYTEALGEFLKALQEDPGCYDAHFQSGLALLSLERFSEAADAFGEAMRLRPDNPEVQSAAGYAAECSGQLEAAAAAYTEALRLAPGLPGPGMGLQRVSERLGRPMPRMPDSSCFEEVGPGEALPPGIPAGQVVVREIVRIPCRYCGSLVDITRTTCQSCGAPLR
jgi:tetratricopeptide (TPR) repeat protein